METTMNKRYDFNIFLIGFMGAGKSTAAALLKQKLDMDLIEMDEEIVRRQGMAIPEIFDQYGEAYFRDLESSLIVELQQSSSNIVSCGGGVVVRHENVKHMKQNGYIVLLTAEPETIYERVKNSTNRPILNGNMNTAYIKSLMEKRRELYLAAADMIIATDGKTAAQVCMEIISQLDKK